MRISNSELIEQYATTNRAVSRIAREEGVTRSSVYWRLKKLGVKLRARPEAHRGIRPPNYKGGWFKDGYHFRLINGKQVRVHRLIMGARPGQVVHHRNHKRNDNSLENLKLFSSNAEHVRHHRAASRHMRKAA